MNNQQQPGYSVQNNYNHNHPIEPLLNPLQPQPGDQYEEGQATEFINH